MKKWLLVVLLLIPLFVFAQEEEYTGQAVDIRQNERGIAFTVVVKDPESKEVLRRDQWVSASTLTAVRLKDAVKNVVERMTMEMYAHTEGSKEFIANYKIEIENYTARCGTFVPTVDRPNSQDERIE